MTDAILPRRNFYVYKLLRLDGRPFYVGKGTGSRIKMHEYKAKKGRSYKDNIICQILATGAEVPKIIVANGLTHEEANTLEIKLIAEIGRHPHGPLTNRTRGGEGIIDMPAESLERKRQKLRGRKLSPEARAHLIRVASNPSPETRAKMSASAKARIIPPEVRRKQREGMIGKRRSDETKANMRAAAKLRSPEQYARAAESRRGSHHTEETKAKLRQASRRQWADNRDALLTALAKRPRPSDETKAKMSAVHKRRLAENPRQPMTYETKAKIRAARALQAPMSDEARAKVSAALRARPPISEGTRQKRRASVLATLAQKKGKIG